MKLVCDNCEKEYTANPLDAALRRNLGDGIPMAHRGETGMLRVGPAICGECRSSPDLGLILQRMTIRANIFSCLTDGLTETLRAKLDEAELKDLAKFIMECVYAYHQDICPLGYQQAMEAQIEAASNDAGPPSRKTGARKGRSSNRR